VLGAAAGLAAGSALVSACGAGGGEGGTGAGAPRAGGRVGRAVELRTHARAGAEKDGYQKNVDAFNRHFEGRYKAVYEPITGDLYQGQETLMAGGAIGDVHYAHQSNIKMQEYAVKGAAIPLDPFIGKDKTFRLGDYPQRAREAMRIIDNKVFALPVRGQVAWLFLYWNRDLLRKAGVQEPAPNWTLDDLVGAARRLQQPGGSGFYPVGYSWGSFETAVANVRRFGGEFFDPADGAGEKCTMDSPQCQQAIKWFHDHIKAGLFAPRTWGAKEFGEGKLAFYFGRLAGERGTVANTAQQNFEWTFDIVPKGPTGRRGGFLSIDTQQINAATKDKDGAWELLKWLTNRDSGVNLALQPDGSLTPGFRKDVYCDDRLLNDPRFPKSAMKANCDNIDQPEGYTYPHNFRLTQPGAIQEVLNRYLNDIADLKQEPNPSVLKQMTAEIQTILDLPRL
jgi:multiple sugar transport system substrate-binding protein